MPAGSTYTPIATTTANGSVSTYTFSSIPSTYTDLRLILNLGAQNAGNTYNLRVNGDTGSNYSQTEMWGNGSAASSARRTSQTSIFAAGSRVGVPGTITAMYTIDLMSYSNATTYKTFLNRQDAAAVGSLAAVGLWRSTSAITSITIFADGAGNFVSGSTFTLYGILAA
jgi:hypothetical protein